ncbi:MAG: PadR family transcriptional regulator [Oscillospiraceae bacterium]|nr:PadR family transcriptional regulator [Oscillospiraceae bacterium]
MYGYQLSQELSKRSNSFFVIQEGSMYPVLYRMLNKELISERKELVGKRRTRVYYHIEPLGLKYSNSD